MAQKGSTRPATGEPAVAQPNRSREELSELLEFLLQEFQPQRGSLSDLPTVVVQPQDIARVCRLAKEEPRLDCKLLLCLLCVDYKEYFQLVYLLHSINHRHTVAVKTNVPYADPRLPSVTSVWRAADWYEREAHDLFGVIFDGHPNLAPLLLYEGFEGFPGRKEYPFNDYQEF